MKTMHTYGPWTVEPPSMGFSQITGPGGQLIFGLAAGLPGEKQHDEICAANAALIAAAPDLFAALNLALEYWAHRQRRYKNRSPVWVQRARAAIAKAIES